MDKVKRLLCCGKEEAVATRVIPISTGEIDRSYDINYTSTTKYNLITFIPKVLFEQYR